MAEAREEALVLKAGEGDFAWVDGGTVRCLARDEDTGGSWSMIEHWTPPGQGAKTPHCHRQTDQAFYILEGTMMFRLGSRTLEAKAGTFVFIPRGLPHANWTEAESARHLLICAPAGLEKFFVESGEAVKSAGSGERLAEAVKEIAKRYDSVPV